MAEIRIKISGGEKDKTLSTIAKHFDVGIRKIDNVAILTGYKGVLDDLKSILKAKITGA